MATVGSRPDPGPGPKRQLTTEGGTEPVWNPDGREFYYRSGNRTMAMPVKTTPSLVVGRPAMLFEGAFVTGPAGQPAYDVAPDGRPTPSEAKAPTARMRGPSAVARGRVPR
jgi:hypothetical protein